MKVLFLTTYNVPIDKEHFFTKSVWLGLCEHFQKFTHDELLLATITETHDYASSSIQQSTYDENQYYKLYLPYEFTNVDKVRVISNFFEFISPSVIHSNMIETFDVQAAKSLNIPIVLTMHIGGLICPRGGGDGFLKSDDSVCSQPVSGKCLKCCCETLPFPKISYWLERLVPNVAKSYLYHRFHGKQIFYLTPFLQKSFVIRERKKAIEALKYATIIAANERLVFLLALNGLKEKVRLIPHGVCPRKRLDFPKIGNVVKFYYLGRIQHSKGLHNALLAFKDIPKHLYEFHIIGDAEKSGPSQRYEREIYELASGLNVYFHGRLANDRLADVVSDMHVMIHPAIFHEIYGIAIAESLSMGRPVIATKCGGAEMQVLDGVNGWLVNQNDVQDLHKKIMWIIDNKSLLLAISKNCYLPHSLSEYVEKLSFLYKDLTD